MWQWFSTLPSLAQMTVGILMLPIASYLLGLVFILFDPGSLASVTNGKRGCLLGPLFLGAIPLGYPATIYGCITLLQSLPFDIPRLIYGVVVAIDVYLFTVLVARKMVRHLEKVSGSR